METTKKLYTGDMIARFKEFFGFRFDTDVARKLGLSDGSAIGNWRRRDSIDILLIAELCPEINLDWLVWGRGNPFLSSQGETVQEEAAGMPKQEIIQMVNQALEKYLDFASSSVEEEDHAEDHEEEAGEMSV